MCKNIGYNSDTKLRYSVCMSHLYAKYSVRQTRARTQTHKRHLCSCSKLKVTRALSTSDANYLRLSDSLRRPVTCLNCDAVALIMFPNNDWSGYTLLRILTYRKPARRLIAPSVPQSLLLHINYEAKRKYALKIIVFLHKEYYNINIH